MNNKKNIRKIGIIGSGISGIVCAYLLNKNYNVTLFEENSRFGGHSHTVDLDIDDQSIAVDTGFIVYNDQTYPNLLAFFKELKIETIKSDMSFGVSIDRGRLEYCGSSLSQFFAQRKNLLNPRFIKMGLDIVKFNKIAMHIDFDEIQDLSIEEFVQKLNLSSDFQEYYFFPLAAAIWSTPSVDIAKFPAVPLIRFFRNHALLRVKNHLKWNTVKGGSKVYVEKALASEKINKITNCKVVSVERSPVNLEVKTADSQIHLLDAVIFATPAHKTLELLSQPSYLEEQVLGAFKYSNNNVFLHSDASFMPKNKRAWASWNYFNEPENKSLGVTYWMNQLQNLPTQRNIFVTLNPPSSPSPDLLYDKFTYEHPLFDHEAMKAQERLSELQGKLNTWFCGSYHRYGFHEDGILSGLKVVRDIGGQVTW